MNIFEHLQSVEAIIGLIGAIVGIILFLYPKQRKRFRRITRMLISHTFSGEIMRLLFTCILGIGIGYYLFHTPDDTLAGDTLARIRKQGILKCGISGDVSGFSNEGKGIDIDYCNALAAAISRKNDEIEVELMPLTASVRFEALEKEEIDVLFRNTSWTVGRDLRWNIDFGPPIFIDTQAILAHSDSGIKRYQDLEGRKICVLKSSTSHSNLKKFFAEENIEPEEIVVGYKNQNEFEDNSAVFNAYTGGPKTRACDAITTDKTQLLTRMRKVNLYDPIEEFKEHQIVGDIPIAKELLSPAFLAGDEQWKDIITYVVWATMYAEELGITSKNVNSYGESSTWKEREFLGIDATNDTLDDEKIDQHIGDMLGLNPQFAKEIIRKVGNYEEIFNRHFNDIFGEDRGPNQIWRLNTNTGILNPPPFSTNKD